MKNLCHANNGKKIALAFLFTLFLSALTFAQEAAEAQDQSSQQTTEIRTFIGQVDAVILADPGNKTPARIKVKDHKGTRLIFIIPVGTPIADKDGKRLSIGRIKKGQTVIIQYQEVPPRKKVVQSIKMTE